MPGNTGNNSTEQMCGCSHRWSLGWAGEARHCPASLPASRREDRLSVAAGEGQSPQGLHQGLHQELHQELCSCRAR